MSIAPRRFSLKFKIVVVVLLVSTTSVWLLTFAFLSNLKHDMQHALEAQQQSTVSYIASDIDAKLQNRIALLTKATRLVARRMHAPQSLDRFLKERQGLHTLFKAGLLVIDNTAKGIAAYPMKANTPGMSFEDMDYFSEAIRTGKTVVGKPRFCILPQKPVVPIAVPIRQETGELLGVLVGYSTLSDKNLFEHLEHIQTRNAGEVYVISPQDRLIVTSNDPSYILKPVTALTQKSSSHPGNATAPDVQIAQKTIPTTGWIVQMATPTEIVFAPIRHTMIRVYGIAGVLTLLTIIALWLAIKNTLTPLEKLSDVIHKMASAKGKLHQLPLFGDHEIQKLLESFNQLIRQRTDFEERIKLSEARLARAEVVSKMGHWELHLETGMVFGSQGAMAIYGLDHSSFTLQSVQAMTLPEYRPYLDGRLDALRKNGTPYDVEFKIRTGDTGEIKDIHSQAVFDKDKQVIFGTVQDITERKKYEEQLRESEARYRVLADNSQDVIWTMDFATQRFTYVSPSVVKLRGFTPEEVMSHSVAESLTPDSIAVASKILGELLEHLKAGERDNLSAVMELEQPHRDGHIIPVEVVASCVLDEFGQPKTIVGITRDITERKKAQEVLERMAHSDPLTGLANRRHFITQAKQELARTVRYGGELSVLMMDIDRFKSINDSYGHHTGDWVIQRIAEVCKETLRGIDVIGRLGGEEFAILLPQTDQHQAFAVAERLRGSIAAISNPPEGNPSLAFTVSIGVATLNPAISHLDTLLSHADKALYKAKHAGRNRVWMYDDTEID